MHKVLSALFLWVGTFALIAAPKSKVELALVDKTVRLRQVPNNSPSILVSVGTNEFVIKQKVSGLFPTKAEVSDVTITAVDKGEEGEVLARANQTARPSSYVMGDGDKIFRYNYW